MCLIYFISCCIPHYLLWPLVHWPCLTCGWKETGYLDHSSKLCCKILFILFFLKKLFIPYCILLPLHINLNIMLMSVLLVQVLSIACCVFYSHCGNRAILRERPFVRKNSNWFSLFKKEERNTWLAKFLRMNELKDQVCSSWFAPVGSASDYPLLSKWVIYGEVQLESTINSIDRCCFCFFGPFIFFLYLIYFFFFSFQLACNGSCAGSSDEISPIYSLWATFIGLYIANYIVERSTG
jgi:hypothetical protein